MIKPTGVGALAPIGVMKEWTPNDTQDITLRGVNTPARGLILATVGAVSIHDIEGTTITFASGELAVGIWHPMWIRRILDTGTTATSIKVGF